MALAEVVAQPRLGLVVVAPLAEFEAGVFPRIKFKIHLIHLISGEQTVSFFSIISRVTGVEYSGVSK